VATLPVADAPAQAAPEIYVHFRLDAPDASSVHLAGDFTGWEPSYELHESQPGVWTVVVPLAAGVHDYAFVIDGETWTPDPLATSVDDGFGGRNSRMSLLPPERMRA
jgi:1,4-alpha-glucan branching enzyme